MTRVAVIAHFLSANLGDRYQGTGLADRLAAMGHGITVDRVNSHPFDSDIETQTVFGSQPTPFDVLNPSFIDYDKYDFVVMPSGSIADDSLFVRWGLEFLATSRLKRLFIWGGFHDITDFITVNDPTNSLRTLFCDPRVSFVARGWLELVVFQMLAGGERGRCGGDPVLLNDFSHYSSVLAPSQKKEATVIISGHAFSTICKNDLEGLCNIISTFQRICFVEGVEDRNIIMGIGEERTIKANTIETFSAIANSSSIVVTQRLHGIAFAKAISPGLPVILWSPSKERFSNIKFRSVAESASGYKLGIAHFQEDFALDDAIHAIKNPDFYLRRDHEINFSYYTQETERTFRSLAGEIVQG